MTQLIVTKEQHRKILEPLPNENYSYCRLKEKDWFRLLLLNPSAQPDRVVTCSLLHFQMDKEVPYEALSYTWGDEGANHPIFVNGCVFRVRRNLYYALKSFRQETKFRLLWIDAVCIDQSHNVERAEQVSQMDRVYSNAVGVLIWLGEGDEYSDLGMDSIKELARFYEEVRNYPNRSGEKRLTSWEDGFTSFLAKPDSDKRLVAIVAVLTRPWWNRVWIVQEIALARSAVVHCGFRSLPWLTFEPFSIIFHTRPVHSILLDFVPRSCEAKRAALELRSKVLFPMAVGEIRQLQLDACLVTLSTMVNMTIHYDSTDPRDKIYGILGLVSQGHGLKPNYEWSVKEVYIMAFKAILQEDGDLRSFVWLVNYPESIAKGLPSWVPYFHRCPILAGTGRRTVIPISYGSRYEPMGPVYHAALLDDEIGKSSNEF